MVRSAFVALTLFGAVFAPASANIGNEEIRAYNTALESGDAAAIAAAAIRLGDGAIASPDHPDASLLAFEAAWALCRFASCKGAAPAAEFSADRQDAPPSARLLAAYVDWKTEPRRAARKAVEKALSEAIGEAPTGVSVSVFREVYAADLSGHNWRDASRIAGWAVTHLAAVDDTFLQFRLEAQLVSISAAFNASPQADHLTQMVHLRGELGRMRALAEDEPDWMRDIYWTSNAWQAAMQAFLASSGQRMISESEADGILTSYTSDIPPEPADPEEAGKPPFCDGAFKQKPAIKYPASSAFRGRVGSVILAYKVRDGRVREPEVLASVPIDGFQDEVVKAVSQWVYVPSEDPKQTGCRLDHDNIVQSFLFQIR